MCEGLITFKDLAIGYGNQPILSMISFSVPRYGFTAILGANGSGKSTLLKTLLGLQPPLSGSIELAEPITFGYVPQSVQFDPLYHLTGFEVALMGVYGRIGPGRLVPHSERLFVHECLRATNADGFARQWFPNLSGGQKQRVLIARALASKAHVLVLDEPTAGVDAVTTHALLEFISQVHREQKMTILLVTHDLPLVRKHAQQVIWIHQGNIITGTPADLLAPQRLAELFEKEIS